MGRVYDSVIAFLQGDNWHYEEIPGEFAIRFSFTGKNARYDCFGRANEDHEIFVFYTIIPIRVPEVQRVSVAELLSWINYGLNIGNFEMDMNDGEIRYKTSIDVEGGDLVPRMVETLIAVNISTTDRYFPSFTDVMYAGVDPAEAVARIERPDPSTHN